MAEEINELARCQKSIEHEIANGFRDIKARLDLDRQLVPIWPSDKWVATDLDGLRIWINLHDNYIARTILEGHYENEVLAIIAKQLKTGGVYVDIGANVGAHALRVARHVGSEGRVFCFEPRVDTFHMLSRSIEENSLADRCVIFNKGLSDKESLGRMRHFDLNPGASFVLEDTSPEDESIVLTTLDEIDFGETVDVLKIDVEGFETKVLRGGRSFFRKYRPIATSEVFPAALRNAGSSSAEEYVDLWNSYDYEVRWFEPNEAGAVVQASLLRDESRFPDLFNVICYPR
ncbi:FkbM family methyltransferase [Bradyrhizobium sp. ORS 375]|uniref:FkbM family methyltransferase n=1 Tax=Bradyrhizobium sp. (strain ORS 375) TaxID=566679 RepID=UPI0002DC6661|nr:FkbM family methyltransferase [Bradyrhizobium sp. ORS 375]